MFLLVTARFVLNKRIVMTAVRLPAMNHNSYYIQIKFINLNNNN